MMESSRTTSEIILSTYVSEVKEEVCTAAAEFLLVLRSEMIDPIRY